MDKPIHWVAASIIETDLYPLFKKQLNADRLELVAELGTPEAIRELLVRFPELLEPKPCPEGLPDKIQRLVAADAQ